jgi:hypothetical protein
LANISLRSAGSSFDIHGFLHQYSASNVTAGNLSKFASNDLPRSGAPQLPPSAHQSTPSPAFKRDGPTFSPVFAVLAAGLPFALSTTQPWCVVNMVATLTCGHQGMFPADAAGSNNYLPVFINLLMSTPVLL